ncbi:MAG: hypothetical protein ABSH20_24785 [Tepidisphaeraceae bacterium]|jgi:hypothetical protein
MAAVKSDQPPIPASPPAGDTSDAARQARHNYATGLAALRDSQLDVAGALPAAPPDVEWLYARDGTLSARIPAGGWLGQCSLPLRAAGELLADMSAPGRVSLLLYPTHAAQLGTVLERLTPQQAVISIHETLFDAACALACHDFSPDIRTGRLYLTAGSQWPSQLAQLLASHPGLPAPQQYLRTALLPAEAGQRLMEVAGQVINTHTEQAKAIIEQPRRSLRPQPDDPVLLLAGSAFRPWDLATPALLALLRNHPAIPHSVLDIDRPDRSSPMALLAALQGHRTILTAELTRANLPQAVPADLPVVTWLLHGQVPPASPAGPHDRLIVASRELERCARQEGWTTRRVLLAVPPSPVLQAGGSYLGIIADYVDLDLGEHGFQLSSHRLLFEAIGEELLKNPLALGTSVMDYLKARAGQLNLRPENLDLSLFIERLILPVYARGIARLLVSGGLPVRLIGARWESDEQLRASHGGNPHSREELCVAIGQCAAIVNVWPVDHPPPLQLFGRPVLPTAGQVEAQLLTVARSFVGPASSPAGSGPVSDAVQAKPGRWSHETPPVLTADMLAHFLRIELVEA